VETTIPADPLYPHLLLTAERKFGALSKAVSPLTSSLKPSDLSALWWPPKAYTGSATVLVDELDTCESKQLLFTYEYRLRFAKWRCST
jgi:hypothetical protein